MLTLTSTLQLTRCPHCSVSSPLLQHMDTYTFTPQRGGQERVWKTYICTTCASLISAWAWYDGHRVEGIYPSSKSVNEALPEKAAAYLKQAFESLHAPSGAVMLAASAVDAMLKERGFTSGNLYSRINEAIVQNVLTSDMGVWAHEIRLDANDERHADDDAGLPNEHDAQRVIDFAEALGQFLFVLPARVTRGIEDAEQN